MSQLCVEGIESPSSRRRLKKKKKEELEEYLPTLHLVTSSWEVSMK